MNNKDAFLTKLEISRDACLLQHDAVELYNMLTKQHLDLTNNSDLTLLVQIIGLIKINADRVEKNLRELTGSKN